MTPKQIFSGTMKFGWYKLLCGLATVLISVILFAIVMGIASLFGGEAGVIAFLFWLSATGVVRFIIMHYIGFMLKAGHVAVITEAVTTGKLPDNQFEFAKAAVKERFVTMNVFFVVDKLVSGAVKQIQRIINKVGDLLGAVPGMSAIVSLINLFISIALGYIDECCLGYSFYKKDQGAFKSSADGVAIYAQNIKTLLKNAVKTTFLVILFVVIITVVCFIFIGGLFKLLDWNMIVGFLISLFVASVIKYAFLDAYILCRVMTEYMKLAQTTEITFDIYGKLCKTSSKFKKLFEKGQSEPSLVPAGAVPAGAAVAASAPAFNPTVSNSSQQDTKFCTQCGAKLPADSGFCTHCGAKV